MTVSTLLSNSYCVNLNGGSTLLPDANVLSAGSPALRTAFCVLVAIVAVSFVIAVERVAGKRAGIKAAIAVGAWLAITGLAAARGALSFAPPTMMIAIVATFVVVGLIARSSIGLALATRPGRTSGSRTRRGSGFRRCSWLPPRLDTRWSSAGSPGRAKRSGRSRAGRATFVAPPPDGADMVRSLRCLVALALLAVATPAIAQQSPFTYQEVMIPVRDGAHLQTVILTPTNQTGPLPILFRRTPYGVPASAPPTMPANYKELARDGYIFVIQNLRGRFKSEGTFLLSSQVDLANPKSVNETTDAYDSIDWLVKHVANNNGKVGMYGVSYDGLTAGLTLLQPHPALKAISEQASPVDQWMNDDDHRYGALRLSYAFEYAVYEQADKNKNTHFDFDAYDGYSWYLNLGPLSNINAKYLHGSIPYWNDVVKHPNYDAFWKREAWVNQLHSSTVPNLNVAGFFDQEDPWGPWQIFKHAAEHELHGGRSVVPRRVAATQGRQHRHDCARRPRDVARIS